MTLERLQPIGLDELVAQAALLTRVDRKYVLPATDAAQVLARLPEDSRVLTIGAATSFEYESFYFDTPDLLSYRMAALGRRRRFKLRTRSYVDSEDSFLEMKTRGARSATVKDRIEYSFEEREKLTRQGRAYVEGSLLTLGFERPEELELLPTLATRYRRTTLLLPSTGSRATVDTHLSWELADGRTLSLPDLTIIETKSGNRTGEVDRLLWAAGHRPATISKYGTGLAALRHDLPSNKWARVLRRHFQLDTAALAA